MSEPVKVPALKPNQAVIIGRVAHMRTYEVQGRRTFETTIIQAAADQFSSPTRVAIQSLNKLGNKDDDVQVHVHVQGYGDSYKTREGEVVNTARNVLKAVE